MRVSGKMAKYLFEAAEARGIPRAELVAPLGLDATALSNARSTMDWDTLVAILDQLSIRVGRDVDRVRDIGSAMVNVPSYSFLKRLARTVVTLRHLYEAGDRWLAPASVPGISIVSTFLSDDRLRVRTLLPADAAPSTPFFQIFEGILTELPTLLGLPRGTIARSRIRGREHEVFLHVPRSRSLLARARRSVRAAFYSGEAVDLLEQQRSELAEGLESIQRDSLEVSELLDRMPDLVLIHRDGTLLWVNRAALSTLGYDRKEELIGKFLLDIVGPATRGLVMRRMHGKLDAETVDLTPGTLLTRDGRTVAVEVSPAQIVTFGGLPARLLAGRDVTERLRMQQRLVTADRLASIGMLAAGVAHEVNNPLAYVLNNIELAMKQLGSLGESTLESRAALGVALEGVDRIRTIVRDLLMLTRDDETVGPIDVRAVVESTVTLAAREIEQRARLVCEYEIVPCALGTEARLGQVLLNLLVNALEAMADGSRETNELRLVVRNAPGSGVLVEVTDNGVGISSENASRVFDPFFTTKPQGRGTGLGLSISQRLVAEIGGDLSFVSTPPRGTTFRVMLPAAEADDRPSAVTTH